MKEAELNFKIAMKAKERRSKKVAKKIERETQKTIKFIERNIKRSARHGYFDTIKVVEPYIDMNRIKEYFFNKGYITNRDYFGCGKWEIQISWGTPDGKGE